MIKNLIKKIELKKELKDAKEELAFWENNYYNAKKQFGACKYVGTIAHGCDLAQNKVWDLRAELSRLGA